MTTPVGNTFINQSSDGIQTIFLYDFLILDNDHMDVFVNGIEVFVGFTITGAGNPTGGLCTFDAPPAVGTVGLFRDTPLDQLVDYIPFDPFPSETHEGAIDKLTLIAQEQESAAARSLALRVDTPLAVSGIVPPPTANASVVWDAAAENLVNGPTASQIAGAEADATAAAASAAAASTSEGNAATSAASINLPTISGGDATKVLRVNGGETGYDLSDVSKPSQSEAEAGIATIERFWTAERVKQAVVALGGPPVGTVVDYAGLTEPTGWVFCDGSEYDVTGDATFANLFTVIGNTYGGIDNTDFKVPDLRGRVGVGKDNMDGAGGIGGGDVNRITSGAAHGVDGNILGASGGAEEHAVTEAEMAPHVHSYGGTNSVATGSGGVRDALNVSGAYNTSSTGGGNAHTNLQPTIILNKIIKK